MVGQYHHVHSVLYHDNRRLWCINLDGQVIYRYDILGNVGLAVDRQGHVYISGYTTNNIHRLSPDGTFRLLVLCIVGGVDKLYGVLVRKSNYSFICTWYYSDTIWSRGKWYFVFVIILDINGSRVREVQTDDGVIIGLFYNERNDQMLLRHNGRLWDPFISKIITL
jgi:hypothetical protein